MAKQPRLQVTKESPSGLNIRFKDMGTGKVMPRGEVVKRIKQGEYPGYHVMKRGGMNIPRSNPNHTKDDNLG